MTLTETELQVLKEVRAHGGSMVRSALMSSADQYLVDDALYCLINQTPYLEMSRCGEAYRVTVEGFELLRSQDPQTASGRGA